MRVGSLGFGLGVLAILALPVWPGRVWLAAVLMALALLVWLRWRWWPWLLAGMGWTLLTVSPGHLQLPVALEGRDLRVVGRIAELPGRSSGTQHFVLRVDSLSAPDGARVPFRGALSLGWYGASPLALRAGERWSLSVRLKRPRGLLNPGGGDSERWLFARRIHARGYVREYPAPRRLSGAGANPLTRWRTALAARLDQRLGDRPHAGLVKALAVGDRHDVHGAHREVLQRTGTAHLLAISGLHVGLAGGWWYLLVSLLWRRLPGLAERLATPRAAALAAIPGAALYALLAGLSLPTQRALAMILLAMLARCWLRPVDFSRLLAMALLATLLVDPLAPLNPGFWLSFGAVGVIAHLLAGRREGSPEQLWWRIQWGITLGLAPLGLGAFQGLSLVSPLANLVAIPWASATVVPLTLLGTLVDLPGLGDGLLALALGSIRWLLRFLGWLADWPWAYRVWPAPPLWALPLAVLGSLWLLAPRGFPGRWLGCLLWLPLLAPPPQPAPGEVWFTLLDVGDGLAAVVRTREHVLVYDTGGRWRGGDAAGATLVPLLRQQGIRRIDTVILSHDDSLHTGGFRSLASEFAIQRVLVPAPGALPVAGASPCRAGDGWRWDGVVFRLLAPSDTRLAGDDQSCVLQVDNKLLLPGDLELAGQRRLLRDGPSPLAVLVAPHHGRRDLLDSHWLARLNPQLVLFSTAYRNHHGYPRPATCRRFAATGARLLDTADHGAISVRWRSGERPRVETERQRRRRFWHAPVTSTCGP